MFLTLTCDSYGRVDDDGTPADPGTLRLPAGRAGRAALRRAVRPVHPEPAPRPRLRRAVLRRRRTPTPARAAPAHRHPRHRPPGRAAPGHRRHLPPGLVARHRHRPLRRRRAAGLGRGRPAATSTRPPGRCCPPGTRPSTPSAPDDEPLHVARFGAEFDAQGVLAGSKDANRCIGYLTKYLTKHVGRLPRRPTPTRSAPTPPGWPTRCGYEPCSPTLRELAPLRRPAQERQGRAWSRAAARARRTDAEHLGYAGPPGAGLAQVVRQDPRRSPRRPQGLAAAKPSAWIRARPRPGTAWHVVTPADPDHLPYERRLLHVVAERTAGKSALDEARRRAEETDRRAFGNREGRMRTGAR